MKTWSEFFKELEKKDYYQDLMYFLDEEYRTKTIYPKRENLFKAFDLTPVENIKVVIIGQDPYHEPGQAQGLAFSVPSDDKIPPSLVNIFKEIHNDIGCEMNFKNGDLTYLAKQGVFLLNTALTVRKGQPLSHRGKGWETFTDHVISILSERDKPMVFLLWGSNARSKKPLIDRTRHLVLEAPHPSPLSAFAGFFGCKHFSKANAFLTKQGETPVDWSID